MTKEEINEAIEKIVNPEPLYYIVKHGLYYREKAAGYTSSTAEAWKLPYSEAKKHEHLCGSESVTLCKADPQNYCGDLNVMHEAEGEILGEWEDYSARWHTYETYLKRTCGLRHHWMSAKANERAEALLRTLNRWKD